MPFCSGGSQINNNINNTIDLNRTRSMSFVSVKVDAVRASFFFFIEAQCTIITATASVLYAPLPPAAL